MVPRGSRLLGVLGIAAAAVAGYVAANFVEGRERRMKREVLAAVKPQPMTAELDRGKPLSPMLEDVKLDVSRSFRILIWSRPVYSGPVSRRSVEILIAARRAMALEHQLTSKARGRLKLHLVEADREICETALLANEELERTKKLLRKDPDRHVIVRGQLTDKDPQWARIHAETQRLVKDQKGYVVSGPLDPDASGDPAEGAPTILYFVEFDRWPILRELEYDNNRAVRNRLRIIGDWIAAEFRKQGLGLFKTHR